MTTIDTFTGYFVLTYEYTDKSGFRICGVTQNYVVAMAWFRAGDEHNIYPVPADRIADFSEGWPAWEENAEI